MADAAGERDRQADDREATADEREAIADERETIADERERALNAREEQTDTQARHLGEAAPSFLQRSREASDRARALLAASEARLARADANLTRAEVLEAREQWVIGQELAVSDRLLGTTSPSRKSNLELYVQQLHTRYLTASANLADAHDMVAQHHEQLAQSDTSAGEGHRTLARQARQTALHLRTAAHQTTHPEGDAPSAGPPPDARPTS
ncbi:hypothetical protein [Streptomyces sp. NPDC055060]